MGIIVTCKNCVRENSDYHGVTRTITETTTFEQFERKRFDSKGYKFEQGGFLGRHALSRGASTGNVKLAEYLVKFGGRHLLELGDTAGATPLFLAVLYNQVECARRLLELGPHVVNMMTADRTVEEGVPGNVTPLWVVTQITKNAAMKVLLLRYGAVEARIAP